MELGEIVRLKSDHILNVYIIGNCVIDDIRKHRVLSIDTKYHITSLKNGSGTWVKESEVDCLGKLREDKLKKLGI
jgi:hypothetical protein